MPHISMFNFPFLLSLLATLNDVKGYSTGYEATCNTTECAQGALDFVFAVSERVTGPRRKLIDSSTAFHCMSLEVLCRETTMSHRFQQTS